MSKSVTAQQYAYILRLLEEDLGLRYPPVTPRSHCHCPNCGRIVVPDEEEEDEDNDEETGDDEDQAEESDGDDEVYDDAQYFDILSDIRFLVKDPFEGRHSRPYEIFDPDLIERHSSFGGGRRKARSRDTSLTVQRIAVSKTNRAAKGGHRYAEQDTTPSVLDAVAAASPVSPVPSAPESDATGEKTLDSSDNTTPDTNHALHQNLKDRPRSRLHETRPVTYRKNSTARDFDTVPSATPRREIASTSICRRTLVPVERPHLELFLRMFGDPAVTATSRTRTVFNDIVAAMSNAGFTVEQSGRCAGSAVAFKDCSHLYNGRTITFHRPHPEPRVPQHMLRKWGKRLSDTFGWTLESFADKA